MEKESHRFDIFAELSSVQRLEILNVLQDHQFTISQIASKMHTTVQALQRHIDRLTKSGMIEKMTDGSLKISTIGYASLEQLPSFSFLLRYKDYFMDHDFTGIPKQLIHRIGELENSHLTKSTMESWQRAKSLVSATKQYFWGMSSMTPIELFDIAINKIKDGVKYRLLFPYDMVVPRGFEKKRRKMGWYDAIRQKKAEERYVRHLPVTVAISENSGQVVFANKNTGLIDGNFHFYSDDKSFRQWCIDLFEYYWEKVPKTTEVKFKEV